MPVLHEVQAVGPTIHASGRGGRAWRVGAFMFCLAIVCRGIPGVACVSDTVLIIDGHSMAFMPLHALPPENCDGDWLC